MPSSHGVPVAEIGFVHAPAEHTSSVHESPSTHDLHAAPAAPHVAGKTPGWHDVPSQQPVQHATPWQTPPAHAVPSARLACPHVSLASLHVSVVHELPSS